jgi:hypothetical protein
MKERSPIPYSMTASGKSHQFMTTFLGRGRERLRLARVVFSLPVRSWTPMRRLWTFGEPVPYAAMAARCWPIVRILDRRLSRPEFR